MNTVCLYVTAAKVVLQADTHTTHNPADSAATEYLAKLSQLLVQLREHFSCAVCQRLLTDPYAPHHNRCQHNVCRLCVLGRKQLRPACEACASCSDFRTYQENRQMRCLLVCYKSLCDHMRSSSSLYSLMGAQKCGAAVQEIINEGAGYEDVLSAFTQDLSRGVCIQTPSPAAPATSVVADVPLQQQQQQPQQPPPPIPMSVPMPQLTSTVAAVGSPHAVSGAVAAAAVVSQVLPKAATPPVIKQEVFSPPRPPMAAMTTNATGQPPQQVQQPQPPQYQQTHENQPQAELHQKPLPQPQQQQHQPQHLQHSLGPPQTLTIKHMKGLGGRRHNALILNSTTLPPGVVVPIVSSSATTSAPLSIASSKMQSMNRQARNAAVAAAAAAQKQQQLQQHPHQHQTAPLTFKVAGYTLTPQAATITTTTTNTVTTTSRQPPLPSIKTVSNGQAMYSVLYTGVGNKITIKRKTDIEDDATQRKIPSSVASQVTPTTSTPAPLNIAATNATFMTVPVATYRQQHQIQRTVSTPPTIVATSTAAANSVAKPATSTATCSSYSSSTSTFITSGAAGKRRGCRCGNATPTPGKLTCCGQRCPCYVESKSCVGCKCRGCRNPHRPDGGKVRPVIPELAAYGIEMTDGPAATTTMTTTPTTSNLNKATVNVAAEGLPSTASAAAMTMEPAKSLLPPPDPTNNIGGPMGHGTMLTLTSDNTFHQSFEEFSSAIVANATTSTSSTTLTTATNKPTATLIPFRGQPQQITTMMSPPLGLQQHQQHQQQPVTHHGDQQAAQKLHLATGQSTNLMQRESVLIQNAEGKYQVVNVFTQQRLSNAGTGNMANTLAPASGMTGNTFLFPQMMAHHGATTTVSTASLPQLIIQQQQHPHQTLHRFTTASSQGSSTSLTNGTNITGGTITLQQLQQLKQQQNIITVHPITTSTVSTASGSPSGMVSTSSITPTITLSPIIVHTPQPTPPTSNFTSDSSDLCSNGGGGGVGGEMVVPSTQTVTAALASPLMHQQHQRVPQLVALDQHTSNTLNRGAATMGATDTILNGVRGAPATLMEIMDTNQV